MTKQTIALPAKGDTTTNPEQWKVYYEEWKRHNGRKLMEASSDLSAEVKNTEFDKPKARLVVNRVVNGWVIAPKLDQGEAFVLSDLTVFTDFIDMCAWLGEYYGEDFTKPESTEAC